MDATSIKTGYVNAILQKIEIGPIVIFAVPGEYFLELANEVIKAHKKIDPTKQYFIIELANDSIGYLYTIDAYIKGGYESSFSLTPLAGRYITMQLKSWIN